MAKNSQWAAPISQRAVALAEEIRRQSQPRRWPWQEKTVRDLLNERRADLAEVALSRSAQLAAAATEQRDSLLAEARRQSQPRRWPWQQQTAYDKFAVQRERLASAALDRATALTDAATIRRDQLLAEARRQSQPRSWPWQEKTLRDKLEDQRRTLAAQTKPSRWPWQEETLRDRFDQRRGELRDQFDQRRGELRGTIADTLPTIQESAAAAAERVRLGALSTADLVQNQLSQAPQRWSDATDVLRENADLAAQRVRERAELAATTAKSAALAPVEAVRSGVETSQQALSDTVEAGKRSAKRGVRVGRVFLWALLIGGIIGVLLAPRAGEETRRNLMALWNKIMETVAPSS